MNSSIREPANFYTHLLPAILAIPGLGLLLSKASNTFEITAALIYGLGMILLFAVSSIYHSFPKQPQSIRFWQKFDHCSIYIMIAGSFTPTCVIIFNNWMGWTLLALIWIFALVGISLKILNRLKNQMLSTGLYILMGCMIIPFVAKMIDKLPLEALIWLFVGGIFYVGGTYYYAKDRMIYNKLHSHVIWHVFVNLGALSHFIYNYYYIV